MAGDVGQDPDDPPGRTSTVGPVRLAEAALSAAGTEGQERASEPEADCRSSTRSVRSQVKPSSVGRPKWP